MATVIVPGDFGAIVLMFVASFLVNMWLSIRVFAARQKYGVKYPAMYSADNEIFNCIQRSHQHYLEHYPFFLAMLIFGGISNPPITVVVGAIYLIGRVVFTLGYSSGDPWNRFNGFFLYIPYFTLFGYTVKFALDLLQWI